MKRKLTQLTKTKTLKYTTQPFVKCLFLKIGLLLMLFSLINVQALAQDWTPFPANQKTWFKFSNETLNAVALYYAANVIEEENEVQYYLDANNTAYKKGSDVTGDCKQFYQDRAQDYVSVWEPFVEIAGLHYYKDQLVFDANLNVGEGIFIQSPDYRGFDEVYLECIDQRTEDVLGQSDEVKEFSLQAYDNGQPVASAFDDYKYILSKSNGFLQFLPFIELLNEPKTSATITGFEDEEGIFRGDKGDQFILPYEVGDVISYYQKSDDGHRTETTRNWRDSITAVVHYQDSLILTFDRVEIVASEIRILPETIDTVYTVYTYNNNKRVLFNRAINDIVYYSIYGYKGFALFTISPTESSLNEGAYEITIDSDFTTLPGCFDNWEISTNSSSYHSNFGLIYSDYFLDDRSFMIWRLEQYQKNGVTIYPYLPQPSPPSVGTFNCD